MKKNQGLTTEAQRHREEGFGASRKKTFSVPLRLCGEYF